MVFEVQVNFDILMFFIGRPYRMKKTENEICATSSDIYIYTLLKLTDPGQILMREK